MDQAPQIEPTEEIAQQSAPPPPQKKSNVLLWLLLFILLVGSGLGLYLTARDQGWLPSGLSPTPTPTVAPRPTPTSDPTANWQTYLSPYNYQIKYPAEWSIENIPQGFSINQGNYKIVFSFPSAFGPGICIFADSPDFNKNDPDDPIMMASKCPGKYVEINGEGFTFRRKETPNMSPEGKQNGQWTIYVKDKDGNFVTVPPIVYEIPTSNYDVSRIELMDQILSTFQFIN